MRLLAAVFALSLACVGPARAAQPLLVVQPATTQAGIFDLFSPSKPDLLVSKGPWGPDQGEVMVEVEEFDEPTLTALKDTLEKMEKAGHQTVTIRIDSYGGSVHWGMEMVQLIEDSGLNTRCVVDSKAMSMGFFFLQACSERYMTKRSQLMAHEPWTRTQGNAKSLEEDAKMLRVLGESLSELVIERSGMDREEFLKRIDGRDWYLGWKAAEKYNFVDGTVKRSELPKLYKMEVRQPSFMLF